MAAFEYADYPEVSAVQPASEAPRRPSVSVPEPPTVRVASADEQTTDNVSVKQAVPEVPVEPQVAEAVAASVAQALPESPAAIAEPSQVVERVDDEVTVSLEVVESSDAVVASLDMPEDAGVSGELPDTLEDEGINNEWHDMLPQLKLTGMAQQLAEHCLFKSQADDKVTLTLDNNGETLKTTRTEEALKEALGQYFSKPQQLVFEAAEAIGETPEKRRIRLNKERQIQAELSIAEDPVILELQQKWGAVVLPGSVKPNKDVGVF